jgi:hypothetical protein
LCTRHYKNKCGSLNGIEEIRLFRENLRSDLLDPEKQALLYHSGGLYSLEISAILTRTIRGGQSRNLFLKAKTPHRISYEFLGINAFQDTQPKAKIL